MPTCKWNHHTMYIHRMAKAICRSPPPAQNFEAKRPNQPHTVQFTKSRALLSFDGTLFKGAGGGRSCLRLHSWLVGIFRSLGIEPVEAVKQWAIRFVNCAVTALFTKSMAQCPGMALKPTAPFTATHHSNGIVPGKP